MQVKKSLPLDNFSLKASNWSRITFYILTSVLTAIFERFGPNFCANLHIADGGMAYFRLSGGQAGCNADFLSRIDRRGG